MNIAISRRDFSGLGEQLDSFKRRSVLVALGGVPLPLGKLLRQVFYQTVLSKVKRGTKISAGVSFYNPRNIYLGAKVKVESFVRFSTPGGSSTIRLRDQVVLSRHVEIKGHAPAGESAHIDLGKNTYIGPYSYLSGQDIRIGKNCLVGPYVGIFANNHNFYDLSRPMCEQGNSYAGIEIGDDCWIGTGAKVLDGVTIGSGSIVGAGAIVTKDLPPYSIAVGIPAQVIQQREGQKVAPDGHPRMSFPLN